MKLVKKSMAALLITVMVFALAACGKKSNSIIGSWKGTNNGVEYVYTFNEDGTGSMSVGGMAISMTYTDDKNGNLVITATILEQQMSQPYTYEFKDKKLNLSDGNATVEFEKSK